MRVLTIPTATLGLAALLFGIGPWTIEAQAQDPERLLEGFWLLNEDLSDDRPGAAWGGRPDDQRDRRQGGSGGFGGRPGGGGRGGGGGGRGGDRPDPAEMAEMREAMQAAMEDLMSAPRRMTIVETEREVLLTYGDGRVVRLIPDGQEHAGLAGNAMEVRRRTKWDGANLVTQIDLQSRMEFKVEQTYEVLLEGQLLVVTSRFESERSGDDEDRELRRVYEREPRE